MIPYILLYVLGLLALRNIEAEATDGCPSQTEYDYIVVGTGATGSVVINRLSEDENVKVLALEAGGYPSHASFIPLIAFKEFHTEMDWNYTTVPQETCCNIYSNKVLQFTRGKCLGGTASINFMTYTRGNKRDYDTWAELGNEGWSFKDLWPYFLNMEDYRVPITNELDARYHHVGGPVIVEVPDFKTKLADAFLEAGQQLGFPLADYNAGQQIGFMYPPVTLHNGSRYNAYRAYLEPAMKRNNLQVEIYAMVTKVLFDENKIATGVEFRKGNATCRASATKEVIVSAGAINSPQLLMLSGIGPKEVLEKFKIPLIIDSPGVGQNLQDHVTVGGQMFTLNESVSFNSLRYETPEYEGLWERKHSGPMTVPVSFEGVAFLSTNVTDNPPDWPDLELFFNSDNTARVFRDFLKPWVSWFLPGAEPEIMSFQPILLRPKSKGIITLQSADPFVPPLIDPKYLSHPDDVSVLAEGVKLTRKLAETAAFQKYGAKPINYGVGYPTCEPSHLFQPSEYYKCIAQTMTSVGYHPSSTCKMGPPSDPMAVVDDKLRVYGVHKLRVADASIMPNIIAGHPQIACMVIGEKLGDLIKENKV